VEVEEVDRVGPERFEALIDLGPQAIDPPPLKPPFVATTTSSGNGAIASLIVRSLSPLM